MKRDIENILKSLIREGGDGKRHKALILSNLADGGKGMEKQVADLLSKFREEKVTDLPELLDLYSKKIMAVKPIQGQSGGSKKDNSQNN